MTIPQESSASSQRKEPGMSRKIAGILTAALIALAMSIAGITHAHAATSLPVTLSATSDGAVAKWVDAATIELSPGAISTTTYAKAIVDLAAVGTAAPAVAPSFTTSAYSTGSPRWVITFANGDEIFGYPAQFGTTDQWEADSSGTYETYAQAIAAVDPAGNVAVTSAYVTADGDQAAGTVDDISNLTYDGETAAQPTATASVPKDANGKQTSATTSRVTLTWTQTVSQTADVVIYSRGKIDGKTAKVTKTQAVIGGLQKCASGHLTGQPTVNGAPEGPPFTIDFKTAC